MRALPLWQPWADLVVNGAKAIETRPRPCSTIVGQRIAIHATLTRDHIWRCDTEPFKSALGSQDMWFGAIIGTVRVVQATHMDRRLVDFMREHEPNEFAFGDWAPGRWAFQLEDPQRLAEPVPWQGSQGVFFVPDSVLGYEPPQESLLSEGEFEVPPYA